MTNYILLPMEGGSAPDGSGSGNNPAARETVISSGTQTANTPKVTYAQLAFDQTTDEHWLWQLALPTYVGGGIVRLRYGAKVTSGNIVWKAGIVAAIEETTDLDAAVFNAADLSAAVPVSGTVGKTSLTTISLTTTGLASNRLCILFIGRDANNAGDTAAGDAVLVGASFEYT